MLKVASEAFCDVSDHFETVSAMLSGPKRKAQSESCDPPLNRGHFPPMFGVICGILGLSIDLTETMYLRCVLRDLISAAGRLNIIGPLQGAKLQLKFIEVVEDLLRKFRAQLLVQKTEKEAVQTSFRLSMRAENGKDGAPTKRSRMQALTPVSTAPILELLQSRHDLLYSRLFNS